MRATLERIASGPAAPSLRPTWIILALSMAATGLLTWMTYRVIMESATRRFEVESSLISNAVKEVMRANESILRSGAGLFIVKPDVSREEWHSFVTKQNLSDTFPGLQGLGYSKVVRPADLANHVAQERHKSRLDYRVWPEGPRDLYTAIVFLEPESDRNLAAIGFDMFSESVRREAMEASWRTGEPHVSRRVTLVQEKGDQHQPGILAYMPIYGSDLATSPSATMADRVKGFVYAAFRMNDLFNFSVAKLVPKALENASVTILDSPAQKGAAVLFQSEKQPLKSRFTLTQDIKVSGEEWRLKFRSTPQFEASIGIWQPALVGLSGSLISFLVSAIAATLAVSRDRAVEAQHALAEEVSQRKWAQEQEQIANRELVHRVKNMMAVVASIASQTARYTPDPEKFNVVFRERLSALGRVHDMLRPNPAFHPDLALTLKEVLKPYAAQNSSVLETEGPAIEIPQNAAVMLSLVVNELATNATKHGAWSTPSGKVRLSWRVTSHQIDSGEGAPNMATLVWSEKGGPAVRSPDRKGFGSNVLKFAIERGLRGKFEALYPPEGFRCELQFPLETA